MEGEWSCYRGGQFKGGRIVMSTEVATIMEGEWSLKKWCLMEGAWSCYRGGQYNGGRIVMLWRWPVYWRENG